MGWVEGEGFAVTCLCGLDDSAQWVIAVVCYAVFVVVDLGEFACFVVAVASADGDGLGGVLCVERMRCCVAVVLL